MCFSVLGVVLVLILVALVVWQQEIKKTGVEAEYLLTEQNEEDVSQIDQEEVSKEDSDIHAENELFQTIKDIEAEQLGFTSSYPGWGMLIVDLHEGPKGCVYQGSFENLSGVQLYAEARECGDEYGRGAWFGDVTHFQEADGGYELALANGNAGFIPQELLIGVYNEGKILVLEGEQATGPSILPSIDYYGIVINLENDFIQGAVFQLKTKLVSEEELIEFVESIEIL